MAYVPYAPSISDTYWLYNPPAGITARFNGDTSDSNWCGMLTDIVGLESTEIRESAEELVEADGGVHGNFWLGRRPIVLTGTTFGHSTVAVRNARLDKIMRASQAFRQDSELHWIPDSNGASPGPEMMTWVRRQQPLKYTGGWNKDFQVPLVSQYARIYSAALHPAAAAFNTNLVIENQGSYASLPTIQVRGPVTNPVVTNSTNAKALKFNAGVGLSTGQYVDVDMLAHTATRDDGSDWTAKIDFLNTTWPTVDTGNNTFILTGTGNDGNTQLQLTWRDTWA